MVVELIGTGRAMISSDLDLVVECRRHLSPSGTTLVSSLLHTINIGDQQLVIRSRLEMYTLLY